MSKLITIFGSNTKPLEAGVARAQNAVDGFSRRVAGRLRTAFSAAIIGAFFKNLIDKLDRVDKLAKRGFSTDFIQDLGLAATKAGSDIEALLPKIVGMWRELNRAGEPSKDLEANLAALGLSVKELRGASPEQLFRRIVAAMQATSGNQGLMPRILALRKELEKAGPPSKELEANLSALGISLEDVRNLEPDALMARLAQAMREGGGSGNAMASVMALLKDRTGELAVVLADLAQNGLPSVSKASRSTIQTAAMLKDAWAELANFVSAIFAPVLLAVVTTLFFAFNTMHRFVNTVLGGIVTGLELTAKAFVRFAMTAKKALTFDFSGAKRELQKLVKDVEIAKATMDALMAEPDESMERFYNRVFATGGASSPAMLPEPEAAPAAQSRTTLPGAIADSLQRIGGGGASFATMQRDRELEQLQAIARASERTAAATERLDMEMR